MYSYKQIVLAWFLIGTLTCLLIKRFGTQLEQELENHLPVMRYIAYGIITLMGPVLWILYILPDLYEGCIVLITIKRRERRNNNVRKKANHIGQKP